MKKRILFLLLFVSLFLTACGSDNITGNAVADKEYVSIPLSSVSTTMTKLNYEGVNYFVVKDKSGEVKTAFDACDLCGSKGYSQSGDSVVCNNCGQKFSIEGLGSANFGGGCWPSHLSHKIEGDNVLVSVAELKANAWRFQ